jgi:Zn-dependent protease with chaperone function
VFAGGLTLVGAGVANMISGGAGAAGGAAATGAAEGAAHGVLSGDGDNLPGLIGSIVIGIAFLCLAHLFAILIYFAISRSREFLADAGAVEITKDADAMISALNKINTDHDEIPGLNANLRAMMISASAESLFSTHPSIDARVVALQAHAGGRVPIARSVGRAATAAASPWGNHASGASMASPAGSVGFGRRPVRMKPLTR